MKRVIFVAVGIVFVIFAATRFSAQTRLTSLSVAANPDQFRGMLDMYCVGCHNSTGRAGGVAFDRMALDAVPRDARIWEAAVRKLRGRLMPPPGSRQPDQKDIDAFAGWLEATIDSDRDRPRAGHVPIQRLTRTEYAAAVKDLVGVEIDAEQILPTEIEVKGFNNIAAALSVSPSFLEQYISAARMVARLGVGEPVPKLASVHFPPSGGDQNGYIEGFPLGTRGGMKFRHNFPADGEYRFTMLDLNVVALNPRSVETRNTVVMLVDGRAVFRQDLGGPEDLRLADQGGPAGRAQIMKRFANIPVRVTAGPHDVVVTFIERSRAQSDEPVDLPGYLRSRVATLRGGVDIAGPFEASGVSKTPSRALIFICQPQPGEERACARRITENLARRAYRRPVTGEDIDRLMPFYEIGFGGPGGFDSGIEQVVATVLASPDFLYRAIQEPADAGNRPVFPLSDLELASRLSFFLWSQGPDEELLEIAAAGKLGEPEVIKAQVRRMLEDSRALSLVRNFALRWLNLDKLNEVTPDANLFPSFSNELREDFAVEVESFLRSVLLEDRNVMELLTANHTYLNERLARHYGIASVFGPQFRRVELEDVQRRGLLGKGAVLLRTSYGDRTSPVLRGAWVLEKLMGTPPAPPPPNVVTDLSTPKGEKPKTLRARLQQHRVSASCNQCHGVIDPIGLAMEKFDAIGRWREVDPVAEEAIDAATVLPNGAAVNGPAELRRELISRPGLFVQALTEKLMMYALGRELEYFDMPQVRAVVHGAAEDDYRFSAVVLRIVNSEAFRMQAVAHRSAPGAAGGLAQPTERLSPEGEASARPEDGGRSRPRPGRRE